MTNPYIRAAQAIPEIKEEAVVKLEARLQEEAEPVRARDELGQFIGDDPATPDVNETWTQP